MGGDDEIAEYENGEALWCITYTFMPDELENLLNRLGVRNVMLAGPVHMQELFRMNCL